MRIKNAQRRLEPRKSLVFSLLSNNMVLDPKDRKNVTVDSLVRIDISENPKTSNLVVDYVKQVIDEGEYNKRGIKIVGRDTGQVGHTVEIIDFVESAMSYDEEKIKEREGQKLEFKSTFCFDDDRFENTGQKVCNDELKERIPKAIAAFCNSIGGILYIGVQDRTGKLLGLKNDFEVLETDADGFEAQIIQYIENYFKDKSITNKIYPRMITIKGQDVFKIDVQPTQKPIIVFKDGNFKSTQKPVKIPLFYVRVGNSSKPFDPNDFIKYWIDHVKE